MEYSLRLLKEDVRQDLRTARPEPRLVTLVCLVASFLLTGVVDLLQKAFASHGDPLFARVKELFLLVEAGELGFQRAVEEVFSMGGQFWTLFVDSVVFALIAAVITWTLRYGYQGYCLYIVRGKKADFTTLLCAFPKWGWVLLAGFFIELFLFLWIVFIVFIGVLGSAAALFFLSGALRTVVLILLWVLLAAWFVSIAISYSMTNFILLDERVDAMDAISRSTEMLRGRKRHMLVLILSFGGWILAEVAVAALVMAVASAITGRDVGADSFVVWLFTLPLAVWVGPYLMGAVAKFYDWMRRTDIRNGDWESSRAARRPETSGRQKSGQAGKPARKSTPEEPKGDAGEPDDEDVKIWSGQR